MSSDNSRPCVRRAIAPSVRLTRDPADDLVTATLQHMRRCVPALAHVSFGDLEHAFADLRGLFASRFEAHEKSIYRRALADAEEEFRNSR